MSETRTFMMLLFFQLGINALIISYTLAVGGDLICPTKFADETITNQSDIISNISDPYEVGDVVRSIAEQCTGLPWWYYLINIIILIGLGYGVITSSNWL